jgi:hypothetical protein
MSTNLDDRDYLAWIEKTTQQLRDRNFTENVYNFGFLMTICLKM